MAKHSAQIFLLSKETCFKFRQNASLKFISTDKKSLVEQEYHFIECIRACIVQWYNKIVKLIKLKLPKRLELQNETITETYSLKPNHFLVASSS